MFSSLILTENGTITAKAQGHPTDVIKDFHSVCSLLLGHRGAWRITDVDGICPDEEFFDSEMNWTLVAKLKK